MPSRPSRPETKLVRELAAILRDSDLGEIEMEHEGLRIRVKKQAPILTTGAVPASPAIALPPATGMVEPAAAPAPETSSPKPETAAANGNAVTSPMVGTVYHASEPGMDPFVTVGSTVKKGDTLVLIEAMKTFNPVTAPEGGTVKAILVADSQPVEFGEPLIIIE